MINAYLIVDEDPSSRHKIRLHHPVQVGQLLMVGNKKLVITWLVHRAAENDPSCHFFPEIGANTL